jgi:hypothetical protein
MIMYKKLKTIMVLALACMLCSGKIPVKSLAREKGGWIKLFDGKTTRGWHTYGKTGIGRSWIVEDGSLHLDASNKSGWQVADGGDICSDMEFDDFDLQLEWKISTNGNSGIIFYVHEDTARYHYCWQTGPEMQVLDNDGHDDGKIIKHRAGDLYDLIACSRETVHQPMQWNKAEIICKKGSLQFFLNGTRVVETMLWNDDWKKLVSKSKFASMPGFGTYKKGHIALQDHGNDVWYRNIRIKKL